MEGGGWVVYIHSHYVFMFPSTNTISQAVLPWFSGSMVRRSKNIIFFVQELKPKAPYQRPKPYTRWTVTETIEWVHPILTEFRSTYIYNTFIEWKEISFISWVSRRIRNVSQFKWIKLDLWSRSRSRQAKMTYRIRKKFHVWCAYVFFGGLEASSLTSW